jgi:cyclic pyranopterin phosphate synthase
VDLRQLLREQPGNEQALMDTIRNAMDIKPLRHHFYDKDAPQVVRFMNMTGG